ncbi:MAG: exodeoxyribonuclease V subunit gamma [Clostridia bacterium]|nr:exodeoxyribonuclease V subunit gamma [Clostridia bacterium]
MVKLLSAYTLSECLEATAEAAAAYEGLGRRNLIFCEDRLTLVAERAIVKALGGTFLTEVTTFARFLKAEKKVLSRQGSVMAVGDILTRLQKEGKLRCFTRGGAQVVGGAKCIYEQLAQFAASELTPEALAESVEELNDDALKNKMLDLSLLYGEYDRFLKENGYLDEGSYLTLLPEAIKAEPGIAEANVFFLCYSSFTAQAVKAIKTAVSCAANVLGIFIHGEEELYTGSAYTRFFLAAKECRKVFCANRGTPLVGEAERLRTGLYSPEKLKEERTRTDAIRIFAAPDKTGEAEFVATQIKRRLMEDGELKYRDFSVLVPDVGGYASAFKKVFSEYAIPYSMDERITLKRHPIAKFLLSIMEVAETRYLPSAVDGALANVFFGESDEYRNYLLKYGNSRGGALREIRKQTGYDEEMLINRRDRLLALVGKFKRRAKGAAYAAAIREVLADETVQEVLAELEAGATDAATRSYLLQILPAVEALVCEVELLTGEKEIALRDFSAVLADGLEATEIAPTPLKTDAVFIGDLVGSRIERTRVLFAVGLTDAAPTSSGDANLVTDRDKEKLLEVKAALEPMVSEVNFRNRENASLNLCTFTDALYLTYPMGSSGDTAVSDLIFYTRRLFVNVRGEELPVEKALSWKERKYRSSAVAPAVRELLLEMDAFQEGKTTERKEYSALLEALEERGVEVDGAAVETEKTAPLSAELLFTGNSLSPTNIEGYFSCPYRNFLEHGLKLKRREETTVMATDTGTLIHAVLEKTTPKIDEFSTEEEFSAYALGVAQELLSEPLFASLKETAAGAYSSDALLREGVAVALAVYRQIKNSRYRVEEVEKTVSTPYFHGKVDRVDASDEYVRIVDYKTSSTDASATSYYVGRKMQLELYMSAVKGERIPAGVFYFPASLSYSESEEGKFRMKGFFNADEEAVLRGDNNLAAGKKSEYFDMQIDKKPPENAMDGETFAYFLSYAELLADKAREEVRSGYIEPTPYGGVCGYCEFQGACGACRGDRSKVRKEKSIKAQEIAEIVKREKEGE